jgi:hypothetical protein
MQTIIEYKGRMYNFNKSANFTEKMFLDRCWYVVKNFCEPLIDNYADIWICYKYYDSEYPSEVMEKIKELEDNMRKI